MDIERFKAALEAKDSPVALVVYRGEICYKSTDDDQSFGIWCPVNYDSKHEFADGTKFYTTLPQRTWVSMTNEQFLEACKIAEGGNYMVAFQRIQQWLMENNT
jgi:hypothetical protein